MIESYNKVSMSDEKIFSRFNELLTPEFLKAKQNLQDKLEQLNSIIKYVDEYEGEEYRLIDVKRYSNKILKLMRIILKKKLNINFSNFIKNFFNEPKPKMIKILLTNFKRNILN